MAEARSPAATVDTIEEAAVAKASLPGSRLFVMSILGGMLIDVGALLAVVVAGSSTGLQATNPGLVLCAASSADPLAPIHRDVTPTA